MATLLLPSLAIVFHDAEGGCISKAVNPRLAAAKFQKGNPSAAACSHLNAEPRLVAEGEDHRAYPDVPAFMWTAQPGNGSTDTLAKYCILMYLLTMLHYLPI